MEEDSILQDARKQFNFKTFKMEQNGPVCCSLLKHPNSSVGKSDLPPESTGLCQQARLLKKKCMMQQAQTTKRLLQPYSMMQYNINLSLTGRETEIPAAACTRLVFHSVGVTLSVLRENVCGVHMRHHTNEPFLKLKQCSRYRFCT